MRQIKYFYLGLIIQLIYISFAITIDCPKATLPISDCFSYCRKKYFGIRNFYNATTENCEASPFCTEEEEYDIETNTCFIRGEEDFGNITANNTFPDDTDDELKPPKINCVNGYFPSNSSICICYPGWINEESSSSQLEEIIKCSIQTDFNSTNNKETHDVSTSNISLILTIVIPTILGIILLIILITCLKSKCGKKKIDKIIKDTNTNGNERPIIIHLSNDSSERMKIKDGDNMSTIQKLGYCTPPRTTIRNEFPQHYAYPYLSTFHGNDNKKLNQSEALNDESYQMKRLFTYHTPDKKRRGIIPKPEPKLPMTSTARQRSYIPNILKTPIQLQPQIQQSMMSEIQFTNGDNDNCDDWICNDEFTLKNNTPDHTKHHQCYSNPHKKIKANNVYHKPKLALTNTKPRNVPQSLLNSNNNRHINPSFVYI